MSTPFHPKSYLLAALSAAALSGCSGIRPASYPQEDFGTANVFSRSFPGADLSSCEAARRALLSQGYVIAESKPAFLRGRKKFQPDHEVHLEIEFSVVCASNSTGSNSTTMFANAVQDSYSLKKSSNSASIGVGVLGSVSLPIGSSDDALVKVGSETISTAKFYDQFFGLVERYLDGSSMDAGDEAEKKEVVPALTSQKNTAQD